MSEGLIGGDPDSVPSAVCWANHRCRATDPIVSTGVSKQNLALVCPGEPGLIGFVRLEVSEIFDGQGQAGTFLQVAGCLLVMDRLSLADRKVDHGSQGQGRGERVSGRQGVGGRDQDVVEDAFEV